MKAVRSRFSPAVTTILAITAFLLPTPVRALQLYSHVGRPGPNAVATRADSLPVAAASTGGAVWACTAAGSRPEAATGRPSSAKR